MKINAPCKDCTTRSLGCHGRCDRYAAYREVIAKNAAREKFEQDEHLYQISATANNGAWKQKKQ